MIGTGVWIKVKTPKLNFSSEGALGCKISPGSGGTANISSKRGYQGLGTAELNDSLHSLSNDTCHLLARLLFLHL